MTEMASDLVREDFTEQLLNNQFMYGDNIGGATMSPAERTFTRSRSRSRESNGENPVSTSSYTLASDSSQFNANDMRLWLRGQTSSTESTGVQNSRAAVVTRSTLTPSSSLETMWYIMAMILPLFSVNNYPQWRCTPSTILTAAELFLTQLSTICGQAREYLRRLSHDQLARDVFATVMDVVLVVYAIGFLVLSLYQASIIG